MYFTVQKALPLLNDGASIIVTGSGVWQKGMPIYGTYAATKAALRSYVRTWTAEFARRGIRANITSPGPIETPILDGQFSTREAADALRKQFKANIPFGRIGLPEEVASAALFLASKESSYITGIDLLVAVALCRSEISDTTYSSFDIGGFQRARRDCQALQSRPREIAGVG